MARVDTPDPCTEEAFENGCTCRVPLATAYDIDPPEPKREEHCPLHGWAPDPDYAREQAIDDAIAASANRAVGADAIKKAFGPDGGRLTEVLANIAKEQG